VSRGKGGKNVDAICGLVMADNPDRAKTTPGTIARQLTRTFHDVLSDLVDQFATCRFEVVTLSVDPRFKVLSPAQIEWYETSKLLDEDMTTSEWTQWVLEQQLDAIIIDLAQRSVSDDELLASAFLLHTISALSTFTKLSLRLSLPTAHPLAMAALATCQTEGLSMHSDCCANVIKLALRNHTLVSMTSVLDYDFRRSWPDMRWIEPVHGDSGNVTALCESLSTTTRSSIALGLHGRTECLHAVISALASNPGRPLLHLSFDGYAELTGLLDLDPIAQQLWSLVLSQTVQVQLTQAHLTHLRVHDGPDQQISCHVDHLICHATSTSIHRTTPTYLQISSGSPHHLEPVPSVKALELPSSRADNAYVAAEPVWSWIAIPRTFPNLCLCHCEITVGQVVYDVGAAVTMARRLPLLSELSIIATSSVCFSPKFSSKAALTSLGHLVYVCGSMTTFPELVWQHLLQALVLENLTVAARIPSGLMP
jgi:hypothetical protein